MRYGLFQGLQRTLMRSVASGGANRFLLEGKVHVSFRKWKSGFQDQLRGYASLLRVFLWLSSVPGPLPGCVSQDASPVLFNRKP